MAPGQAALGWDWASWALTLSLRFPATVDGAGLRHWASVSPWTWQRQHGEHSLPSCQVLPHRAELSGRLLLGKLRSTPQVQLGRQQPRVPGDSLGCTRPSVSSARPEPAHGRMFSSSSRRERNPEGPSPSSLA